MLWAVFLGPRAVGVGVAGFVAAVVVVIVVVEGGVGFLAGIDESLVVDLRLEEEEARDGYRFVRGVAVGVVAVAAGSCCRGGLRTVASMTWGGWKKVDWASVGAEGARPSGFMVGLNGALGGGHGANVSRPKSFSGPGESSAVSQEVHASVVGKPNELAERVGESGDRGEDVDSDVKSTPKSSVSNTW